jgi:hypothetical protein
LDYVSCILTILSTILIGKRHWQGWILAAVNSVVVCFIGWKTAQMGFIPANLFCIGIYAYNLKTWRKAEDAEPVTKAAAAATYTQSSVGRVSAPSAGNVTSAAYLANTPLA